MDSCCVLNLSGTYPANVPILHCLSNIQMLLQAGADVNRKTVLGNITPLHIAATGGGNDANLEVIATLIAAGADRTAVDGHGCLPLHQAIMTASEASSLALIRGGRGNALPLIANESTM